MDIPCFPQIVKGIITITSNMEHLLFGFVSLLIALISGIVLGGYAKYVKRDKKLTQTFSLVGIISTFAFIIWALLYL
jgi:ABC-type proline/glycine betaine transport system permease subunit